MSSPVFARVWPDPATLDADGVVAAFALGADAPADRPRVVLNMVSSLDGRVRVDGRSRGLGGPADRALFHALRRGVDAVMVGGGTARTERYGALVRDPPGRPQPVGCVVSARLHLSVADVPLLADPGSRVVVLTSAPGEIEGARAQVEYVRSEAGGPVDLAAGLRHLRAAHGVQSVLCEGGPTLNAALLEAGVVDELLLTLSPLLAGGEDPLSIVSGGAPGAPRRLELRSVQEADGALFLRYGIAAA